MDGMVLVHAVLVGIWNICSNSRRGRGLSRCSFPNAGLCGILRHQPI